MNDEDVTRVTRNNRSIPPEIKLAVDLIASAAMLYYITHPDCLSEVRTYGRKLWGKVIHHVSIWTAVQDIRSLDETEDK